MSNTKQEQRITKIKKKFGANAFKNWGGKTGGSPVLKAWREGRITIHKSKQH
jgi:hypothetical protein